MPGNLVWIIDKFEELDIDKLYKILYLRAEVFVVEQNAAYLDPDNKDQKALHIQAYLNDDLCAYCRIFKSGDYFDEASIGRVVIDPRYRGYKYGHLLMEKAIDTLEKEGNETCITISAQFYLKDFYASHGFGQTSDIYLEDGIPHIQMKRYNDI